MRKHGYWVTVPAAYTGVTFLLCWTYLMFYARTAGIEAAAPISLYSMGYTVSALCMVATLLGVAFAPIDRLRFLTEKATKIAVGIVVPVGTACMIAGETAASTVVLVASGVVTGVATGVMAQQWILAYARVGLRAVACSFPLLMAMSVGVCVTVMYLPHNVVLLATVACPIVSEVLFHEVRKEPWPHLDVEEADVRDQPINFILLLLPFAVFSAASGFLDYSSADNDFTFVFYAFGSIVPLLIAGVFVFLVERQNFVGAFLAPAAVIVAVCVPFLTLLDLAPLAPFISIGELGIEVLIFVVAVGFAQFFSLGALKTYALARMVYVLFNGVGWYVAELVANSGAAILHSQMSLVIVFVAVEVLAVCLIVAIVKARKQLPDQAAGAQGEVSDALPDEAAADVAGVAPVEPSSSGAARVPSADEAPEEPQSLAGASEQLEQPVDAVESICSEYGLSARERDVFALLARGYTSTRIQKELYIAAGTVNYHTRNIYAKLGVHSKQELIALFESTKR